MGSLARAHHWHRRRDRRHAGPRDPVAQAARLPRGGKGLARVGNVRVRRGMIQLAWQFLSTSKTTSSLVQWVPSTHGRRPQDHAQDDDCGAGAQAADCALAFRHHGRGAAGRHSACGVMRGTWAEENNAHLIGGASSRPADDDPRWSQPEAYMVLRTLGVEWARRPGDSPPMRMLNHGSDPFGIYRIQVCRATSAPGSRRARLGIHRRLFDPAGKIHPTRQSRPPVLATVKDKSLGDGPAPTLDRHCARRPHSSEVGTRR